jgi:hypothetical protein
VVVLQSLKLLTWVRVPLEAYINKMVEGTLYHIETNNACFGIIVKDGIVVDGAPIAGKSFGRNINQVVKYYKKFFNAKITKSIGDKIYDV